MGFVNLRDVVEKFSLEEIECSEKINDIDINTAEVNRPGLQLVKYYEHFDKERIQIIGNVETAYLEEMSSQERLECLDGFFKCGFPCIVVARNLDIFDEMKEVAKRYNIPILRTREKTSRFLSNIIEYLNEELAPIITLHGVFIEVYGEGILILGKSGVGKSEAALELVKRGHRLVADDIVEVKKISENTLIGTAPSIIRHFIEIRGIGILDIKKLYGVGSVKVTEKIALIINLEYWDENKNYDRLGLLENYTNILGVDVPSLSIPVGPGRNLAVIVEVAAINIRQRNMGYNAAKVLNDRVLGKKE